jgi:DEP domain-containing protein 5
VLVHADPPTEAAGVRQALHLEVTWLMASGRVLDDLLQQWGRRAERAGLTMIEAPYEQSMENQAEWPFQTLMRIPLAARPPPGYEHELLRRLDYVLDYGTMMWV